MHDKYSVSYFIVTLAN